jgi:hypothetical protein
VDLGCKERRISPVFYDLGCMNDGFRGWTRWVQCNPILVRRTAIPGEIMILRTLRAQTGIALLGVGIILGACASASAGSTITEPGAIQGRVFDVRSSLPIWRANVYLQVATDTTFYVPPDAPEDSTSNVYTDSTGAYHLRGVQPGTYHIRARFIGYQAVRTTVRVRPGEVVTRDARLEPLE